MKEINKLVNLITNGLKSSFGVIDLSGRVENPGKEQQLYNGVVQGLYSTDEITAKGMYDTDMYDQRFRMLKSRLRYKLYDLIYHLDFEVPKYSFRIQKQLECKDNLHKASILYELGEYDMAEKLFNKVIVIGNDCHLTSELIDALELRRKVLARSFKPTDFDHSINELNDLRRKKVFEIEAEDIFLKVEMLLSKSIHSRNISIDETREAIAKLEGYYHETYSFQIFNFIYHLKVWLLLLEKDFSGLLGFLEQTEVDVTKMSVNLGMFDFQGNNMLKAKCCLFLGEYGNGMEITRSSCQSIDKSIEIWFDHAEIHFLLAMHGRFYKEAKKILGLVFKNPSLSRMDEGVTHRWKLFRHYLNFAAPSLQIQKRIRVNDSRKASNYYFKEAKGYKISLFILEFIHAYNREGLLSADSRMESLEEFFETELNDPGKYARERQLIKMIRMLKASNYKMTDDNKACQYLDRMSERKGINAFADPEIIPYEDLWDILCRTLGVNVESNTH